MSAKNKTILRFLLTYHGRFKLLIHFFSHVQGYGSGFKQKTLGESLLKQFNNQSLLILQNTLKR